MPPVQSVNIALLLQIEFNLCRCLLNGHIAGVQAQVVVCRRAPGFAGVVAVIFAALLIRVPDAVDCNIPFQRKSAHHPADKQRRKYYNYYTGKTWDSAANYDLCLNTGSMTIQEGAELIKCYLKQKGYID